MVTTYTQHIKNKVRHKAVKNAIDNLTTNRSHATVIPKSYVRDIYDFFSELDEESPTTKEVKEINKNYIKDWEMLHDSFNSSKNPDELVVCYLCGPEPNNDFQEFIDFGVLPQNIWAFEMNNQLYKIALSRFNENDYPQPKIVRQKLENFFKFTPKKFDIVYIDACGAIPSEKHALKCVRELFLNVRLNSPGVLITNFSTPDNQMDIAEYVEVISMYLYFHKDMSSLFKINKNSIDNVDYNSFKNIVKNNFEYYYSEFISMVLRDLPSVLIPLQRIRNNQYFKQLFPNFKSKFNYEYLFSLAKNNGIAKFVFTIKYLKDNNMTSKKIEQFIDELGNLDDLVYGFEFILKLHNGDINPSNDLNETIEYFNSNKVYQFLDKVHVNMFYDTVIFQLTYPMHYNNLQNYRCCYVAKEKKMMLDVTTYDECRYLYEWLPTMHQILNSFKNKSWQYVYRFALDGLVKSRKYFNNELFFQGSVISDRNEQFKSIEITDREEIGGY